VAVIGSAASAVQFVPEIAAKTNELYLFQRTANWVVPKDDTPYTPEQLAHLRDDPNAIHESRAQIYKELNDFHSSLKHFKLALLDSSSSLSSVSKFESECRRLPLLL
jgi:cation diffusion facilitator CzcD-associated flavoprotein CzcO